MKIRHYQNGHEGFANPSTEDSAVLSKEKSQTELKIRLEHRENLLLCAHIRAGLIRGVEVDRIKRYADWYWKYRLLMHFRNEEKFIFPVLGKEHVLVKRALREHRRIKRHFESRQDIHRMLNRIEEELEAHVRFEEIILFKEIEKTGNDRALAAIERLHEGVEMGENSWQDRFWE